MTTLIGTFKLLVARLLRCIRAKADSSRKPFLRKLLSADPYRKKQIGADEQRIVLRALAREVARRNCRFLEIGSWCGDSSVELGDIAKEHGGTLFCLDWWKGNVGTDLENIAERVDVFSLFWERICERGLEDVVVPIRARSDRVAGLFHGGVFDLIYIDADHRYDAVLSDIQQFSPLVRDDCEGRLSDYDPEFLESGKSVDFLECVHCGVVLAVGRSFQDYSLDYSIWSARVQGGEWRATQLVLPCIRPQRQISPPLIESYGRYNILRYGGTVFGLPQSLGRVDACDEAVMRHPDVVKASTVAAVRSRIEALVNPAGNRPVAARAKSHQWHLYKSALDQSDRVRGNCTFGKVMIFAGGLSSSSPRLRFTA